MTVTADLEMTAITPSIHNNVLETIGNTPLVRLHKVARGVRATLATKVEFMNPGGSVKDRIGIAMIEDAEQRGLLKPGGTIVEPTSGNTGMGLAIAAAIKGYKTIFVMPDKMSEEKIRSLRAFGARVVITPTAVEPNDPRSYYSVSRRLAEETPNAFLAGQYWNPSNPETHYRTTGPEIWRQTGGKVAAFVAGIGTGGTISGTGRYLKERNPKVKVIAVDPIGSIYTEYFRTSELGEAFSYKVEGVGEDFLPSTMDFNVVDEVVQISDRESFLMTRRLVREEGLFCGGSCGMAVAGALKWLRGPGSAYSEDDIIVVLLPDSGNRYLSKIFDDTWMRENGFLEETTVTDMLAARPREVISAQENTNIETAIRMMKTHSISQLPVLDENGKLHGIINESDVLDYLVNGGAMDHSVADLHTHTVAIVSPDTSVDELTGIFGQSTAVVVVDGETVAGIVTKIDVIDFLANREH